MTDEITKTLVRGTSGPIEEAETIIDDRPVSTTGESGPYEYYESGFDPEDEDSHRLFELARTVLEQNAKK